MYAISTATVYADTIAMTAHDLGMDVDELNKQFGIKAQNLSDNEAYNQYQNDNIATLRGRVEENVYKNESGDKTLKQVQSDRLEGDSSQGQGDWVNEYAKEHPEVLNDDELLFQENSSKIKNLQNKAKELGLNKKSMFDNMDNIVEQYKKELLNKKELELEEQGYSDEDIKYELEEYEKDAYNDAKDKYYEWYFAVEDYVAQYAQIVADYCNEKGYIVDIDKSKQSVSTYVKLYETEEQQENGEPVKEIRISDHKNNYGDKDIMVNYADDINDTLEYIDNNVDNIISEEFKKSFNGVVFDKDKIHKELIFTGLSVPDIQKKIRNFYNKYLKTKNENTLKISKDGIGELHFSNRLKNNLTTKKDFEIAQFLLSNIEEIVDKGTVSDVLEEEKNEKDKNKIQKKIETPVIFHNEIYNIKLIVQPDNRGNWVIDVNKINISQGTKVNATQSLTDTNIITDVSKDLNPNVTKHEDKNIQFQSMTKEQLLNVYMNQEFGMSADDITDMVTEDIKSILTDYDVSEDEFKFEDIRIYGSYSKGTNKVGSDLDIVVQYSGSMREDSAFNMLHDEELSIYDKKGNKVKIDINPINTADHGTIDEYSKILFQSAYHGTRIYLIFLMLMFMM